MNEDPPAERNYDDVTVSVIIPYCERYTPREMLEEAIESARSQEVIDTEVIVVEDEEQRGPAWARNTGLDRAETQYAAFLDGDDIWRETKLIEQLEEMDETGAGMCVDGEVEYDPIEFAGALMTGETFGLTSSILVDTARTSVRFDETLTRREDHLYMIEVATEIGVCFRPDTFIARKYEDGLSEHVDTSPDQIDEFFEMLTERVPAVKQFERPYYQNAYVYLGRNRHEDGQYWDAVRYYVQSIRLGPTVLAIGALGLTLLEAPYDYLTRPARRILASRTRE